MTKGMVGYFFGSIEELKLAAVTRHYGARPDEYRVLTETIPAVALPAVVVYARRRRPFDRQDETIVIRGGRLDPDALRADAE